MADDNAPLMYRAADGSVKTLRCRIDLLDADPIAFRRECEGKPQLGSGFMLCRYHLRLLGKRGGLTTHEIAEEAVRDRRTRERDNLRETIKQLRQDIAKLQEKTVSYAGPDKLAEQPTEKTVDQDGVVYYLRSGGFYKIGWASNLANRMRAYPPDTTLIAVHPGTRKDERALHKRFAHQKTHGREWFSMGTDITAHINAVVDKHGAPPPVDFSAKPVQIPMPHRINARTGPTPRTWGQHS